jgi:hypothetical protein
MDRAAPDRPLLCPVCVEEEDDCFTHNPPLLFLFHTKVLPLSLWFVCPQPPPRTTSQRGVERRGASSNRGCELGRNRGCELVVRDLALPGQDRELQRIQRRWSYVLVEIGPEGWTPTQQPPEFSPSLRLLPRGYYFYLREERER